jgi:hypothetical protein
MPKRFNTCNFFASLIFIQLQTSSKVRPQLKQISPLVSQTLLQGEGTGILQLIAKTLITYWVFPQKYPFSVRPDETGQLKAPIPIVLVLEEKIREVQPGKQERKNDERKAWRNIDRADREEVLRRKICDDGRRLNRLGTGIHTLQYLHERKNRRKGEEHAYQAREENGNRKSILAHIYISQSRQKEIGKNGNEDGFLPHIFFHFFGIGLNGFPVLLELSSISFSCCGC